MRPRLLIIDDDENILDSARDILEDAGYDVTTAGSVREGFACLAAGSFSLVISDLNLPDGSGLELATQLKSKLPCPRIILITGEADGSTPAGLAARQQGLVDDWLVKPVNVPHLLQIIHRHIS